MVDTLYEDRWIQCTADAVVIRAYYLPWGTKRVRYQDIREVRRVPVGLMTGKGQIWGSSTLRYWASLDPGRRKKSTALILDTGRRWMLPFITPDDPAAVATVISQHSTARITDGPAVMA